MFSRALKIALAILAVSSYKTVPLAYMVRFYWKVTKSLLIKRKQYKKTKENTYGVGKHKLDIFRAVTCHTYASPLEIDMYMHKSNSTYLVDLDLARTDLVLQVFQKLFMKYWNNENGEFRRQSIHNCPYIPVGTIQCSFRRELKLFERYTITSSVMAWDDKWLYVLLRFLLSSGKLCAVAVTKYVFKKKGRITMKPREYIAECGLYNEEVEKINTINYELVSHLESTEGLEELAMRMDS